MTLAAARRLAVGDLVLWRPGALHGTVASVEPGKVTIRWLDGTMTVGATDKTKVDATEYWKRIDRLR